MNTHQDPATEGRSDFPSTQRSTPRFYDLFGRSLPLLLKREYWEHRGGFLWAPIWMTVAILTFTVLGMITAEVFRANANVHVGISLNDLRDHISASEMAKAGNALDMAQLMFGGLTCISLFFVLFFYLLGALYDDRRDRSVLFWKSLPVTDTATVASKALAAMLVAPIIAFVVSTASYIVFLVLVCVWAGLHGLNALPAVAAAHPIGMMWRLALTLPLSALWALPTVGWLLFWSAYVRSKPFLWAVLIPFLALIANWWLGKLGAPHFTGDMNLAAILGRLLFSIMPLSWLSGSGTLAVRVKFGMEDDNILSVFDPSVVYRLLAEPNLWIGVIAGLALLVAAIWFRQRRIETAS
jgi:ABC-2 type transport system permease protein